MEYGGLGALNLYTQNGSLLLKHLHKFFNKHDIPWVQLVWNCHYPNGALPIVNNKGSFWWNDTLKCLVPFKGLASITVSECSSCFFWEDVWNSNLLGSLLPELFSFAKSIYITVQYFVATEDKSELFYLPLSTQAYDQFRQLESFLEDFNLHEGNDIWSYIWGSPNFDSNKAYLQLIGSRQVLQAYRWLWNSSCQPKRKFFFWLLLKDRLNTRELLRRKTMELENYNCALCFLNTDESLMHLFFHCPFCNELLEHFGPCSTHSG